MLPILVREADTERLDLRRLDLAAIQLKIAGRYDLSGAEQQQLAEYLARHSDGNPLFLVELLRTLEIEQLLRHDGERWTLIQPRDSVVPPLLHQVIDRRLGRLRPATRDARPTLERAAALEARIGLNRPNPDGLTAREVEILRLIAASHSNRKIADALFISPRTIERHIANIYLKIDAHSKAEATAYARRYQIA